MGITQAKFTKRKKTGGRFIKWRKKRKFELGRPASNTKLGVKRVRPVRCRGGNKKMRALRLDVGNFSWPSEKVTRKAKILDVVYNASNNELVRTKTIVKNCILKVDASAFKTWYQERYAVGTAQGKDFVELADIAENVTPKPKEEERRLTKKEKREKKALTKVTKKKVSSKELKRLEKKAIRIPKIDPVLKECMRQGFAYVCVTSRPGQVGRADGYIMEGKELDFYRKKMDKKKQK